MIRTCPKCRAFYADEALAFCLADGWPLLSVAPESESWQEAVRAIEEKTQSLRKHQHKLRLRRVLLGAMTTLILALIVSRSYVVEKTPAATIPPVRRSVPISRPPAAVTLTGEWPPEFLLASELPSPSPSPSVTETTEPSDPTLPTESSSPTETTTDTSDPTVTTTASPSPVVTETTTAPVVYTISGRVSENGRPLAGVRMRLEGSKATTATTDYNGYYTFNSLHAGGSYTITPLRDKTNFKPLNRSFDNLAQDGSADFTGISERDSKPDGPDEQPAKCTEGDEARERKIIVETYSARWRESAERERQKILTEDQQGVIAETVLVPHEPQIQFFKDCKAATVIYKYTWRIRTANAIGFKERNVPRQRIIGCVKVLGRWMCS